ncbi:LAGLIDADG family homing endonuclease [Actinoplanes sp. NPDC000266]
MQFPTGLSDDTPVLTTAGWTKHGELRPGDYVRGPDGKPKKILAVTGSTERNLYRVIFDRGVEITATGGHLWQGYRDYKLPAVELPKGPNGERRRQYGTYASRELTWTTSQIAEIPLRSNGPSRSFQVDLPAPIDLPARDLPVDPYILGLWLGDGNSHTGIIGLDLQDAAELDLLGHRVPSNERGKLVSVRIPGLTAALNKLGLIKNKHIPEAYLNGSIEQRLALLQGLMDTDGCCFKSGQAEFTNTNFGLADGVAWLVTSLQFKYTRTETVGKFAGKEYRPVAKIRFSTRPDMPTFRFPRKLERQHPSPSREARRRQIQRVEPIGRGAAQCITVEGSLYLAGRDLVITQDC